MEWIPAKTILNKVKWGEDWFGCAYNFNLYRGCPHGCIYCDSRNDYYGTPDFDRVRAKEDCIAKLEKELASKKEKGIVGIGAMSDAYNPFEKQYELTRRALELLLLYGYGVSIETKSSLILRDLDLLCAINRTQPVIVKLTVTTPHDALAKKIEPHVCPSSERLRAVRGMREAGLFAGIILDPVLPFISDRAEDIRLLVRMAADHGAKYIWSYFMAVSLHGNQKLYFYEQLDKGFPGLRERYETSYGHLSTARPPHHAELRAMFEEECEKYGILYSMPEIIAAAKEGKRSGMFSEEVGQVRMILK